MFLRDQDVKAGRIEPAPENLIRPLHYGDWIAELRSLYETAGLVDHCFQGKLLLSGKDAVDLLNRISTNDINRLITDGFCPTVLTSPKGKVIDFCRLIRVDSSILLLSAREDIGHVADWIRQYIIMEDVRLDHVSGNYVGLRLAGPRSPEIINNLAGQELNQKVNIISGAENIPPFFIINTDRLKVPSYDVIVPAEASAVLVERLGGHLEEAGGRRAGHQAYEVLRVESGVPAWGNELSEEINPYEARLTEAVNPAKGCYFGQEVIARLATYDKVQKLLTGFTLSGLPSRSAPHELFSGNEKIGILTSIVHNPLSGMISGLGYMRKSSISGGSGIEAEFMDGETKISVQLQALTE